ncbi:MAG TPA: serine hydrolase domain-containing protein [Terriglobia bacterium]|jgi:CubicO group peptidase (beta-lactamase class C family)
MTKITRREFAWTAAALALQTRTLGAAVSPLDDVLRTGIQRRKIPAVAAMVATADKIRYQGAFGKRDVSSGIDVTPDSIFAIASMTKAITSTAALQLVDQGKLKLDEPVSKHLRQLGMLRVLEGYDSAGKPVLRAPRTPVTLHHLLTHTSGLCYDTWSGEMVEYEKRGGAAPSGVAPSVPLMFDPGKRWQYGYSTDWTGRLVEKVSGLTLEQYFQRNILQPLAMKDTSFIVPPEKFDRLVSRHQRQADGSLQQEMRALPPVPAAFNGGGGLYSTAGDYVRFMQMILRKGRSAKGEEILRPQTVAMMSSNQIGDLGAGKLKTFQPARSSDVDLHPGAVDRWGLGFLINTAAYPAGRSAGSLAWAGIANTFYWIDPKRGTCATIMMQFLPFVDKEAVGLLSDFERAAYSS